MFGNARFGRFEQHRCPPRFLPMGMHTKPAVFFVATCSMSVYFQMCAGNGCFLRLFFCN